MEMYMRSINECSHCAWNNHFGKMSHCSKIFIDHKIKLMWHLLVFFFSALRKKSARRQPNRRKKSFIQTVKQNFMAECLKHFNFIYYFLPVSTVFLVVKFYVFHKWNSVTEKKNGVPNINDSWITEHASQIAAFDRFPLFSAFPICHPFYDVILSRSYCVTRTFHTKENSFNYYHYLCNKIEMETFEVEQWLWWLQ